MTLKWNTDGWSGNDPDTAHWYLNDDGAWTGYSVTEWKHDGHYVATVKGPSNDTDSGYATVETATNLAEAKGIAVTTLLTKTEKGK